MVNPMGGETNLLKNLWPNPFFGKILEKNFNLWLFPFPTFLKGNKGTDSQKNNPLIEEEESL